MPPITPATAWDLYSKYTVPKGAGKMQIEQTRMAFYAGMESAQIFNEALAQDDVKEEDAVAMLDAWVRGLEEFRGEMVAIVAAMMGASNG